MRKVFIIVILCFGLILQGNIYSIAAKNNYTVGEYFRSKYTKKDNKAVLSSIKFYIQGFKVPYILEDGGEYYLPVHTFNDFLKTSFYELLDQNPKKSFYNLNYKTTKKIGSVIGRILSIKGEEDLCKINGLEYLKLSKSIIDWEKTIIFDKKTNTFYYGSKPNKTEQSLKKDIIYNFAVSSTKGCRTNTQKVKALHDKIILKCSYDKKKKTRYSKYAKTYDMSVSQDHAIHMLQDKKGVCENYARLFKECCDRLFIPCNNIDGWSKESHMWNKVYVGGKWYHIDLTFDDPIGNKYKKASQIRRTYYLKSAYNFMGHHIWDDADYKITKFNKKWKSVKRNKIKTNNQYRQAAVYASYLCRNLRAGKSKTYKFKIKNKKIQINIGSYILAYHYVNSLSIYSKNGYIYIKYFKINPVSYW